MIIGAEVIDNSLMVSYYNGAGKIDYIRKPVPNHEIFNWVEHDRPSLHRNWDGKFLAKAKSDPKWLSRTRLEELIIEKLTPEEMKKIYSFENLPKKEYLDIEIYLTSDEFPKPEEVKMPVALISFCDENDVTWILSIMKSDEYPNGLGKDDIKRMENDVNEYFRNITPHNERDKKLFENKDYKIKHKFFETEKELLEFYFHKIAPRQSFITGWNVIDFDWKYLMNRASKIGVDSLQYMTSRKTFSNNKVPTHLGIVDYKQVFQDPGFKPYKVVENYQLDYIASLSFNATKLKHPYKDMREFQKDVYMFTMYNVIDNILVKLIEEKFGLLEVVFSLANIAEIEVNKVFSPVHVTEVLMCREFLNRGLKMLKKPWDAEGQEDGTYAGAYVMPPIPGYYTYITCYDFKSMYPNLQMQFNISPDSYLGKIGMKKTKGHEIFTKNNTLFDSLNDSAARTILSRLYNARIKAQDEIKKLKHAK